MEILWCKEKNVTGPKNSRHIFIQVPHPVPPLLSPGDGVRVTLFKPDQTLLNSSAITYL